MSESRIQDWIRYVQERAENVAPAGPSHDKSGGENAPRENAPRENAPRENAPRENAPRENAPRENAPREKTETVVRRARKNSPSVLASPDANPPVALPTAKRQHQENAGATDGATGHDKETQNDTPQNGAIKSRQKRQRQRLETRAQLLERLTNPTISLHEASILLNVCSATVRRYTNSGVLPHARTEGGQRRFRLRDVLALLREIEARKKADYPRRSAP